MKKLVVAVIGGQLHLFTMMLATIGSNLVRHDAARSLRAQALTGLDRVTKELNEARERAIAEMQESVSDVFSTMTEASSAFSTVSTEHFPEEIRPQVERVVREMKKLQRTLPTQLTEKEEEALREIYQFFDPLIARFEELRKQFDNLKL